MADDMSPDGQARVLVCAYACLRDPGSRLPGGGDLMAWNIVTRLSRHCRVWVLTSALNKPAIEEKARENPACGNLHFRYVGLPKCLRFLGRFPGGVQLYAYIWQWRAYFAARRLHARIGFHGFHHLTYENDWMASPTGALLPVPYLRGPGGGAHRTPPEFIRGYPFRCRLWEKVRTVGQWIFRHDPLFILGQYRAKAILVCNREALDAIPKKWCHKARLFPVNGVSPEAFQGKGSRAGGPGGFRIVTAGRLVRLKAFDLPIRAFAQFVERTKPSASANNEVVLSIIGEGPERERLESLARRLGVGGLVQFIGWKSREELWARMRSSDLFLFPSLRDGGGAVVVEAMAAGNPIVCVGLGGPGMHVTAECGVKVRPRAPAQVAFDLASALEMLYRQPEICRGMGRAARRRAKEFYLWDALAERLLDVYRDIFHPAAERTLVSRRGNAPRAERLPGHAS
ncbi:MAG TPA: glycosyltransferase [Candidatus Dormibacteraeota bacterium]|nr:glycosyltransferase [Candidatus Dormibacteraeota bacterium]